MEQFVNGVTLHYTRTGTGAPLLLLHGNGETHEIFDVAAATLAEHFTVYAIDTRGHGKSSPVAEYHYRDMAEDIIAFCGALGLEKPVLYGFSDGGIAVLLAAAKAPLLPRAVIASGANISPRGLTHAFLRGTKRAWRKSHDPLSELILREPHIGRGELAGIRAPVLLTAGEHDLVRTCHTKRMARAIPGCTLRILQGETHGSYIEHTDKIARIILEYLA